MYHIRLRMKYVFYLYVILCKSFTYVCVHREERYWSYGDIKSCWNLHLQIVVSENLFLSVLVVIVLGYYFCNSFSLFVKVAYFEVGKCLLTSFLFTFFSAHYFFLYHLFIILNVVFLCLRIICIESYTELY